MYNQCQHFKVIKYMTK